MLGLPGHDERIANSRTTTRNTGRAAIPILGFQLGPNSVRRTERAVLGQGGGTCTRLAPADSGRLASAGRGRAMVVEMDERPAALAVVESEEDAGSEEQMWKSYVYDIKAVLL